MKGKEQMKTLLQKKLEKLEKEKNPIKNKLESLVDSKMKRLNLHKQETVKPAFIPDNLNRLERNRLEYLETCFYNLEQLLINKNVISHDECISLIPGIIQLKGKNK